MKKILLFLALILTGGALYASEPATHFYVWVNSDSLVYQLDAQPKVVFEQPRLAVLYVQNEEVLRLDLGNEDYINVYPGIYTETPTAVDAEVIDSSRVSQVGKYIIGGQLIIIRDEHWYDVRGNRIK